MRTQVLVCLACFSLFAQTTQGPPKQQPVPKPGRAEVEKQDTGSQPLQPNSSLPPTTANPQAQADQVRASAADSHSDQYNANEQQHTDWPIVILTLMLVIVGVLQTRILNRQTDIVESTLEDNKEATKLAHKTLVLSQRPALKVRNIVIDEPDRGSLEMDDTIKEEPFKPGEAIGGTLSLANSGNGKAIVRDSYCQIFNSGEPQRLPMRWPHVADLGNALVAPGTTLQPGKAVECKFSGLGPSVNQIVHAGGPDSGKLQLYVLGRVNYADELGLTRRMVFCRRYHRGFEKFVPVDDPDYENAD